MSFPDAHALEITKYKGGKWWTRVDQTWERTGKPHSSVPKLAGHVAIGRTDEACYTPFACERAIRGSQNPGVSGVQVGVLTVPSRHHAPRQSQSYITGQRID